MKSGDISSCLSGIVIACSSCSIGAWQAIFSGVKLSSEICIVSCLAIYGKPIRVGRVNLNTTWKSCSVENCEIEARVQDICTAISSGALTGRGTHRARSAA